MSSETPSDTQIEFYKVEGALDVLFELREILAQWTEEAQDDSKHEALENILGHIEAVETEYKHRRESAKKALSG